MSGGRGRNPNSLANLKPFGPGYDPNRRVTGRPLGASFADWLNVLSEEDANGEARYDEDALRKIVDNVKAPHCKKLAAREILAAHEMDFTRFGRRIGRGGIGPGARSCAGGGGRRLRTCCRGRCRGCRG